MWAVLKPVLHRQVDRTQTHRYSLFSITTPIVGYSGDSEWILDTRATYHVCPNKDSFSSFEKLDGVLLSWVMIAHVTWKE